MFIFNELNMKGALKLVYRLGGASIFGLVMGMLGIPRYIKNLFLYTSRNKTNRFSLRLDALYPRLGDATSTTKFDKHYIYHVHWALNALARTSPQLHVDFSSSLNFVSSLAVRTNTIFYDFRPADLKLENLKCFKADLLNLTELYDQYESVSCMHVLEHIGLGRYGDRVLPGGDLAAINQLKKVVKVGGNLLVVVPVGFQRLYFDAHRVYEPNYFASLFLDDFELVEFGYISNKSYETGIITYENIVKVEEEYGCGCFWFKKIG